MYLKFTTRRGSIVNVDELEIVSFGIVGCMFYGDDPANKRSAVVLKIVSNGGVINEFAFFETEAKFNEKIKELDKTICDLMYKGTSDFCKKFPIEVDSYKCRVM